MKFIEICKTLLTTLSMPSKKSIKKNMSAQSCGTGSKAMASGYVTKASPAPPVATDSTGMPDFSLN